MKSEDKRPLRDRQPADYLKQRMVCHARRGVEQAVSSCLSSQLLVQDERLNHINSITGLPILYALKPCKDCQQGKKLMARFERRFGKYKRNWDTAYHRSEVNYHKYLDTWATPQTVIHLGALAGYPNR